MLVLDRFDRRKALAVALAGLVIGTAAGGFATGLGSMLAARVLAGAFGGPAAALAVAIIADVVPLERRGRAMGIVMGAFSAASVLGVPAGLELARLGGWRVPFFAVAAVGVVLAALAIALLPPLTGHRAAAATSSSRFSDFVRRPAVLLSLLSTALVMLGNFLVIPNLAAYWMFNFGYPRERLSLLYFVGGIVSFITMPLAGRLVDRFGSTAIAAIGTGLVVVVTFPVFIYPLYWLPVLLIFATFMGFASFRIIPMQTLGTKVPRADERARFMSANSAVQHLAAAIGAIAGAQLLSEAPNHALIGMDVVGWLSVTMAAPLPFLLWAVERRLRRPSAAPAPLTPTGPATHPA
jgi:predicted MFS family arabinose efflux permease